MTDTQKGDDMGQVIQIDEARIKDHLGARWFAARWRKR